MSPVLICFVILAITAVIAVIIWSFFEYKKLDQEEKQYHANVKTFTIKSEYSTTAQITYLVTKKQKSKVNPNPTISRQHQETEIVYNNMVQYG